MILQTFPCLKLFQIINHEMHILTNKWVSVNEVIVHITHKLGNLWKQRLSLLWWALLDEETVIGILWAGLKTYYSYQFMKKDYIYIYNVWEILQKIKVYYILIHVHHKVISIIKQISIFITTHSYKILCWEHT